MKKRAASRPRTRQPEPTELAPLVGVLLRVRFPEKEVLGPVSPEGSEYPPNSMERRAWENLMGIVLSSLTNVGEPESSFTDIFELHVFSSFQYIGTPGGVFPDVEEGWLLHELKKKLPEFVRNPGAGEATLIEYDRPEVGRCKVNVRRIASSNAGFLTNERGTATISEVKPKAEQREGLKESEDVPSLNRPGPSIERSAAVRPEDIQRTTGLLFEVADLIAANPPIAQDLLPAVAALVRSVTDSPHIMTPKDVAEELQLGRARTQELTAEGRLGGVLVGVQNLYPRRQVEAFKQMDRPRGRPKT